MGSKKNNDEGLTYRVVSIRNEDGSVTRVSLSNASKYVKKLVHQLVMVLGGRQSDEARCRRYGIPHDEFKGLFVSIAFRIAERGDYLNHELDDSQKVEISENGVMVVDYLKLALEVIAPVINQDPGFTGYDRETMLHHKCLVLSSIAEIAEVVLTRERDFGLLEILRYLATADLTADRETLAQLIGEDALLLY